MAKLLHKPKLVYFAVNKPAGVVSTSRDPAGRPRVTDLLPPNTPRVVLRRPARHVERRADPGHQRRRAGQRAHASAARRRKDLSGAGGRAGRARSAGATAPRHPPGRRLRPRQARADQEPAEAIDDPGNGARRRPQPRNPPPARPRRPQSAAAQAASPSARSASAICRPAPSARSTAKKSHALQRAVVQRTRSTRLQKSRQQRNVRNATESKRNHKGHKEHKGREESFNRSIRRIIDASLCVLCASVAESASCIADEVLALSQIRVHDRNPLHAAFYADHACQSRVRVDRKRAAGPRHVSRAVRLPGNRRADRARPVRDAAAGRRERSAAGPAARAVRHGARRVTARRRYRHRLPRARQDDAPAGRTASRATSWTSGARSATASRRGQPTI